MPSIPENVPKQYRPGFKPDMVAGMQDVKPGLQHVMTGDSAPVLDILADGRKYKGVDKLKGKNVLITGADSGIGASFAVISLVHAVSLRRNRNQLILIATGQCLRGSFFVASLLRQRAEGY
jgi:hypothetical protein